MKVPSTRWLFALLLSTVLVSTCFALAAPLRELTPPGLADGPGIWANIWNYPAGDVDAYCANLRNYGVRNVFIQTSRSNTPAIAHPDELGTLIDACHRHKIRVIAWAYLELHDPIADADKMLAAAKFRSPSGDSVDAIAPDLEKNLQNTRISKFSERLRQELGPNYPLIAVVYSPLNHYQEVANTPWKTLARYYDVIAPMSYWNSKFQKLDAHDYTLATVRTIREMTGRPDIEVHVIGDGMGTSAQSIQQFLKACRRAEATSASIYPNQKVTQEQLVALSRYPDYFEPNARFRLAAFREMLKSGTVATPPGGDPAQPISRLDFFKMVATQSRTPLPAPDASDATMNAPIRSDEALSLLAQIVDIQQVGHKKRRGSHWFAPAAAAAQPKQPTTSKTLNYLDASQMVLQATSAIR
jgi:hypothetical protein